MHWWNTVARQFHRKPEWIAAIVKKSIGRRSWLVEVNGGTERDTACLDGTKSYSKHTEPRVTHACRPSIPAYSQLQGCAPPPFPPPLTHTHTPSMCAAGRHLTPRARGLTDCRGGDTRVLIACPLCSSPRLWPTTDSKASAWTIWTALRAKCLS